MPKWVVKFLLTLILIVALFLGVYVVLVALDISRNSPLPERSATRTPDPDTPDNSATQMSDAGEPIPTVEYSYIYNRDLAGLQTYLDGQAQNWVNMSMNIHSGDVNGAAYASQTIYNHACTWKYVPFADKLCRSATIEYISVYKAVVTGGVESDFVLHPTVTLKEDWSEINRTTTENKVEVTMGSTVVITYSGRMCITSVEMKTPSNKEEPVLVDFGQAPPTDDSYTLKTKDERLLPNLGPYKFDSYVNEEALRIKSQKDAKDIALNEQHLKDFLKFVEADLGPDGPFDKSLQDFYTTELATLYGVKGFEIVIDPSYGDNSLRCDGTSVIK